MASMEPSLDALEIITGTVPDASVIWLHGLGADGHDFADVVNALKLPVPLRFVLPHAPLRAITINGGYRMPAWYDVLSTEIAARQDAPGIRASQQLLESFIARERQRGIAARRILLAGFSQGGAIALHSGLRHADRLGGIIALSTYLPLMATLDAEQSAANAGLPIFMGHGRQDTMIPIDTARASRDFLLARDYAVSWHEYAMPHSVCADEIADIRDFIVQALSQ
ncbi:carboxylesterase 2 [mine drainage metagenome]|uniref:Carboxylesterase 2 n=1 Tax=mine drainage metagenome TaxID=410659 RepID=A0A1J5R299_9ZZZZ